MSASINAIRALVVIAVVLGLAIAPGPAFAQSGRRPVEVEIHGLFGDDGVGHGERAPLRVQLRNLTARTFSGTLQIRADGISSSDVVHDVPVDLPAGATRTVQITVDVGQYAGALNASFKDNTTLLGLGTLGMNYADQAPQVVILSDPPRLRGALQGMQVDVTDRWGSMRTQDVEIGTVTFDAQTGDPLLPVTADGWASVSVLVASAPDLERATPEQARALFEWVHVGGRVLIFPKSDGDFTGPHVRSLLGDVSVQTGVALSGSGVTVPAPLARRTLVPTTDGDDWQEETFGGSRGRGFGRVYAAAYDGMSPPWVEGPEPRTSVRAVLSMVGSPGYDSNGPRLRYGEVFEHDGWNGQRELRSALDPNESFRPALAFVAFVLLFYVVIVGPLNFRFVAKRAKPTWVLVTTPILALGCLALLLMVGYIGKGTTMRYRAASLVELVSGDPIGPSREYVGLFLTRPASFDLDSPRYTAPVEPQSRVVARHAEEGVVLTDLSGGLWETLFFRTDEAVDFGGSVDLETRGGVIASVRNGTARALHGAFVIDAVGAVYPVGDLPAGATGAVATAPTCTLNSTGDQLWGEGDPNTTRLLSTLGLRAGDSDALHGVLRLLDGRFSSAGPVLFARLDDVEAELADRFESESQIRLIRVVPRTAVPRATAVSDGTIEPREYLPELNEMTPEEAPTTPLTEGQPGPVGEPGLGLGAGFAEDAP